MDCDPRQSTASNDELKVYILVLDNPLQHTTLSMLNFEETFITTKKIKEDAYNFCRIIVKIRLELEKRMVFFWPKEELVKF